MQVISSNKWLKNEQTVHWFNSVKFCENHFFSVCKSQESVLWNIDVLRINNKSY